MTSSTYNAMLAAAIQQNPNLASNIVQGSAGMNDPATESIAASEYLLQGAQYLENQGISDPTVLQAREYYNFGLHNGANLAAADPGQTMAEVMPSVSSATLVANGITPGETVGQVSVTSKLGNSVSAPVLG